MSRRKLSTLQNIWLRSNTSCWVTYQFQVYDHRRKCLQLSNYLQCRNQSQRVFHLSSPRLSRYIYSILCFLLKQWIVNWLVDLPCFSFPCYLSWWNKMSKYPCMNIENRSLLFSKLLQWIIYSSASYPLLLMESQIQAKPGYSFLSLSSLSFMFDILSSRSWSSWTLMNYLRIYFFSASSTNLETSIWISPCFQNPFLIIAPPAL